MAQEATVQTAGARVASVRDRVVVRATAVPAWAYVGALVVASTALRFVFAANKPAPWIFPDSLVYSDLAKSFADTGHFALREVPGRAGFGVVYPLLLAPAYAVFESVPDAFTTMKAINCVVMSLAAVPTYLLARSLVGRWLSLTAAALAVTVADLGYTGTIMTENAFYPAFAFWSWATVRALQRPTVRRQLLSLALLAVAFFTRPQAVVLVPALATALALVTVLEVWAAPVRRPVLLAAVRRYATFWSLPAAGAIVYVVGEVVIRGKSWAALLGSYSFLGGLDYNATDVGRWLLYHAGELDFALAVLPFAALLLVAFAGLRPRGATPELRAFAALAASATFWLLLGVAIFATTPYASRILERSAFYAMPLFMVALVVCVGRELIWTNRSAAAAAAVIAVGFVGIVPYVSFLGENEANDAFSLMTLNSIVERGWVSVPQLQAAAVAAATVGGLIFMLMPRRFAIALPLLSLVALALVNGPVERRIHAAAADSRNGGIQTSLDWIDRAVGTTKPVVTALWSGRAAYVTLWDNEFFNRSVGAVYNFYGPPEGLPQATASIDATSGAVRVGADPVKARYVLVDPTVVVRGQSVAADRGTGMEVVRVAEPLRLKGQIEGIYPDRWSGPTVTYHGYGCANGRLTVTLLSDRDLHPEPQTIVAKSGSKIVGRFVYRPGTVPRKMTVPVQGSGGACTVAFDVPVAVPLQVTHLPDARALGVRFLRFDYAPST